MKAKLKVPWRCPRGRLYPAGTLFIRKSKIREGYWYEFNSPGWASGGVYFSDKVFKKLTPEEAELRRIRQKLVDDHIKKINPFLEFT